MKAIQPYNSEKLNSRYILLYIVHFITHFLSNFFSLLRRFVSNLRNKVLGLYSFKTLWRRSSTFSAILLFVLCGLIIAPIYNKVDEVEAATSEQTTPTLTLNITNATANLDLVVSDNDGTFAKSDSNATFTVTTNNFTGYTLSIKSSSSNTDLSGSFGSFTSISSSMDSDTFDSSTYNGKWGYLPSKYNSGTNTTTYYPSPNATGSTLDATSSANSTANSYTIGIGARADYSKPVGTYTNTYVLTTVVNSFSYSISYNKGNTTDTVTSLPSAQTASSTSDTSVVLSSTEPSRDSYTFTGWCSTIPTATDGVDSCSGDTYAAGATYYFNKTVNNSGIILYAMWEKALTNVGYIQDVTLNTCAVNVGTNGNAANIGDTLLAIDRRDNNTYTIRYINGYCWMTQNLRITGTIDNTNGWSNFTASSFNVSQYDLTDTAHCGSGTSGSTPLGSTNACSANSNNNNYGAYYNYPAATAGTITGYTNSTAATQDICPAGWHLPTGPAHISNTDFYQIYQSTDSYWIAANTYLAAFTGVAAGGYSDNSLNNVGAYANWWTASTSDAAGRWGVVFRGSDGAFSGNSSNYKYYGLSIRCVKTNDGYMQDIIKAQIDAMDEGTELVLADKRDENTYSVAKINGQLWMTQNLRIAGTISATYSNFSGNDVNISQNDLTSGNSYTEARTHDSGNSAYGVWYNFCAAAAKTGDSCTESAEYKVSTDICPSGWRLPTYSELWSVEPYTSIFDAKSGGHYAGGSLVDTGVGYYWSSTASPANVQIYQYILSWDGSAWGNRGNSGQKSWGHYVRCVADPPIYMQDVDSITLAALMPSNGDSTTLTDKRDGQKYTVARIDDKYIMTQNLNYIGGSNGAVSAGSAINSNGGSFSMSSSTSASYTTAYYYQSGRSDYGTYYNYCAASGGSICTSSNSAVATNSVCPTGWMLPASDSATSFGGISTSSLVSNGNLAVYAGIYYNDTLYNEPLHGFWWSAKAHDKTYRYDLHYRTSGEVNAQDINFDGTRLLSVRCIKS